MKSRAASKLLSEGMRLGSEREEITRYAQRLRPDGLVTGTSGNLSARSGDLIAMTPSGLDYDTLQPSLVSVVNLDGERVEGDLAPTSEISMHLAVYERTDAGAAVHTHSPFASVLSTLIDELPPIHYLIAELGGPVRVAPYATFGTAELAENMARALEGRHAALLANHGTISIGETVAEAYSRIVTLEWLAAVYYRARQFGEPRMLSMDEVERVVEKMADYGQVAPTDRGSRPSR